MGRFASMGFALGLALAAPACIAPPAILAPIRELPARPTAAFPLGTSRIQIPLADGGALHGLYVPADPDAPVVLHFVESGASCGDVPGRELLAQELADLGYASLLVDYEGVGLSPGERSIDHLARDARAAWTEAVRIAGAPERVVLRGGSIGTIAAGILLSEGATPMAVVLVAPVRADTVVRRGAASLYGWPAGWFAALVFRRVADVDLTAVLARVRAPLFVAGSRADEFVGAEHVERFERSVRSAGGTWFDVGEMSHIALAALGLRTLPGERTLLRTLHVPAAEPRAAALVKGLREQDAVRLPEGSAERGRLEALARYAQPGRPALDVAAVLGTRDAWDAARMRWNYLDSSYVRWDEALRALLDLEDPAGPISVDALEHFGYWWLILRTAVGSPEELDFDALLAGARKGRFDFSVRSSNRGLKLSGTLTLELAPIEAFVTSHGMPPGTTRRRAFRLLCKLFGIPERPSATDPSAFEVFRRGKWVLKPYPPEWIDPVLR